MVLSGASAPMIDVVARVAIVTMRDSIPLQVECGREHCVAGKRGDDGQEVEVMIDSIAMPASMIVIGRRVSREEKSRDDHDTHCPDCPTHSFHRMHQISPPSWVHQIGYV